MICLAGLLSSYFSISESTYKFTTPWICSAKNTNVYLAWTVLQAAVILRFLENLGELSYVGSVLFFFFAAPFFINILDILLIKMETKCILIMYVFSFCQNITFWDVHHLCHLPAHQLVSINLSFFSLRALSRNEIINIYWHFYLLACLFSVSLSTI